MGRYIPRPDYGNQMLPVRDFLVCKLIKQAGYMDREPAVIDFQRPVAQYVEHLGVHHG